MKRRSCAGSHLALLGSAKFVSLKKKKKNKPFRLPRELEGHHLDQQWNAAWTGRRLDLARTSYWPEPYAGACWKILAAQPDVWHLRTGSLCRRWHLCTVSAHDCQNSNFSARRVSVPPRAHPTSFVSLTSRLFCLASRFNVPVLHAPPAPPLIHSSALSARSLLSWFLPILSRSWLTSCILIIHYRRLTWAAPDDFAAVAFPLVCCIYVSVAAAVLEMRALWEIKLRKKICLRFVPKNTRVQKKKKRCHSDQIQRDGQQGQRSKVSVPSQLGSRFPASVKHSGWSTTT